MGLPAHSHVGASSADRWMNCPGSVRLSAGVKSSTSEYAAEGTAAHWVGEMGLNGVALSSLLGAERKVGKFTVEVTPEMIDHVQGYVDYCRRLTGNDGEMTVEQKFHLKELHPALFGTADAVIWKPSTSLLHVIDFKYGQGVIVSPDSTQLRYYALGALLEAGHPASVVLLHIYQPRAGDGEAKTFALEAIDLLDFAADLVDAVRATEDPKAPLNPGDWCRWCPAAPKCPALQAKAQEAAASEFSDTKPMASAELGKAMQMVPVVESWAKRVREAAYETAMRGDEVPGYKLVEKRATRRWQDMAAAAKAFGDIPGATISNLITPAQMEKLVKGLESAPRLADFVVKSSSGLALVPEEDNRPAHSRDTAQDDFQGV